MSLPCTARATWLVRMHAWGIFLNLRWQRGHCEHPQATVHFTHTRWAPGHGSTSACVIGCAHVEHCKYWRSCSIVWCNIFKKYDGQFIILNFKTGSLQTWWPDSEGTQTCHWWPELGPYNNAGDSQTAQLYSSCRLGLQHCTGSPTRRCCNNPELQQNRHQRCDCSPPVPILSRW